MLGKLDIDLCAAGAAFEESVKQRELFPDGETPDHPQVDRPGKNGKSTLLDRSCIPAFFFIDQTVSFHEVIGRMPRMTRDEAAKLPEIVPNFRRVIPDVTQRSFV